MRAEVVELTTGLVSGFPNRGAIIRRVKRFAFVLLLVMTAVGAATQANATPGWHRCQPNIDDQLSSVCDGRGRVLFPYVEVMGGGEYGQFVRGFRQTSTRRAIADTHVNWGLRQGECGQNGFIKDCVFWAADERIRYRTSDGGRHWRPVSFHRQVTRYEGPLSESVDDHPPLQPCNWSHAHRHELMSGLGSRFGNWCAPPDEWKVPDSLR